MQIWELFRGYEKARGLYEVKRTNERGKAEGRALTIHEGATQHHWDAHLSGKGAGLGIIPLLEDDTVAWACIDIDVYNLDHAALEEKINKHNLPLVMCRSKSGGAHCFIFLKDPLPAVMVLEALESWAALLGHGGCEIFPKQSSRYDEHDIGNWLNMPYYDADETLRYGIKDGKQLELSEFLEYAETRLVTEEQLVTLKGKSVNPSVDAGDITQRFYEGPPCLQMLYSHGGFPDGTRNEGMFNVAVYLRKRFPDDWKEMLQTYNVEMSDPPLSLNDIQTIIKSVSRKDYTYKCSKPPINAHCNRRLCIHRDFGVGETVDGVDWPEIGDMVRMMGDPPVWYMNVGRARIQLTADDILNQNLFKRKVLNATNRIMRSLPQPRWEKLMDEKTRNAEKIEVPEDATPLGQFRFYLDRYLIGMAQTKSKEELARLLAPYRTDDGQVWFRSEGLMQFLDTHGVKYASKHHVWLQLRDMGAESKQVHVKGFTFNVWIMPMPGMAEEKTEPHEFGVEEF